MFRLICFLAFVHDELVKATNFIFEWCVLTPLITAYTVFLLCFGGHERCLIVLDRLYGRLLKEETQQLKEKNDEL